MRNKSVEDGTWTMRVRTSKGKPGIWGMIIREEEVRDPRLVRARLDLEGGPVLVSASDLRRAMDVAKVRGKSVVPLRINLAAGTINGERVAFEVGDLK